MVSPPPFLAFKSVTTLDFYFVVRNLFGCKGFSFPPCPAPQHLTNFSKTSYWITMSFCHRFRMFPLSFLWIQKYYIYIYLALFQWFARAVLCKRSPYFNSGCFRWCDSRASPTPAVIFQKSSGCFYVGTKWTSEKFCQVKKLFWDDGCVTEQVGGGSQYIITGRIPFLSLGVPPHTY